MRLFLALFVCFSINIHDFTFASRESDLQDSLTEFNTLYSQLFDTQITIDQNESVESIESDLRVALDLARALLEEGQTPDRDYLLEKGRDLRNIIVMANNLGCSRDKLTNRVILGSKHTRFPRIKRFLDHHRTRQLQQCNSQFEQEASQASDDSMSANLIDKIRQNIQSYSTSRTTQPLNESYATKIFQSTNQMLQNEPYLETLKRLPRHKSVAQYREEFTNQVLDLFRKECRPLQKAEMYNLVHRFQDYQATLISLNAISTLESISSKTVAGLQRVLICMTIESKIGDIWEAYLKKVYDPVQMMQALRKTSANDMHVSPLQPDEVAGELEFIKYVADQKGQNSSPMARLNYELDHYLSMIIPTKQSNCNLDKVFELLKLKQIYSGSINLMVFFNHFLSDYMTECFIKVDKQITNDLLPKIPISIRDSVDGLQCSVLNVANIDALDNAMTIPDEAIHLGSANYLKSIGLVKKNLTDQYPVKYMDYIIEPCETYRKCLGSFLDDLQELTIIMDDPSRYYTPTIANIQSKMSICNKVANDKDAIEAIRKKLRFKPRWMNLACFANPIKQTND